MAYLNGKKILFSPQVHITEPAVVQTTGDSETAVMSQKAVTEAIANVGTIDQTYNPASENAQSGKAVKEAILHHIDENYFETSSNAQSGKAVAQATNYCLEQAYIAIGASIYSSTDKEYSPTSENAQSGIAVAQALANVGEKTWELIEDIALTEEAVQIDILSSKLQGVKELHISAYIVPADTTITNQDVVFGISGRTYWTGKVSAKATGTIKVVMDISISPRKTVIFDGTASAYDYTFTGTSYKGLGYFRTADMNDENFTDLSSSNEIWMRTTAANPMTVGTRIKVWGR